MSEDPQLDGQVLGLTDAVDALLGCSAALLIRVPGKLALHLPEPPGDPVILSKAASK